MTTPTALALHPDAPARVLWHGPYLDFSGFGDEMRAFVLGLKELGHPVVARSMGTADAYVRSLPPERLRTLLSASGDASPRGAVHVLHHSVAVMQRIADAPYQVARAMFESDALPPGTVPHLTAMDELWVPTYFNVETFRRAGVKAPIHVVPGGVDPVVFHPDRPPLVLEGTRGKVFLSVFEWRQRKGWDVLLSAWARAFSADDDVTLVLRTSVPGVTNPAVSRALINGEVVKHLRSLGVKRRRAAPIVILTDFLAESEMPSLYNAADFFVLPTRGEGWGRPYLEAMASGVPVLGTRWGGQLAFMRDDNSMLIDVDRVSIADRVEDPVYQGQRWASPSVEHLAELMRGVVADPAPAERRAVVARRDAETTWTWEAATRVAAERLEEIHDRMRPPRRAPRSAPAVRWVGAQGGVHSFALVNRALCTRLAAGAVDLECRTAESAPDLRESGLAPGLLASVGDVLGRPAKVEVRHQWPPDWTPPTEGAWVVNQPWEFGGLPDEWLPALQHDVDEVWCVSTYVRDVYLRSGVPADKLRVVPNGVDGRLFSPTGERYALRTRASFVFLFVGGTLARKGVDVLLKAYLAAFGPDDDVCLVVKATGARSFYRGSAQDELVEVLRGDPSLPEIELIDEDLSDEEVAALYRSCDVLVHPYRGEGFGLPVAEAMATGLPVIVTDRGACSDFCDDETAFLIPSEVVPLPANALGPSRAGYEWAEPDPVALAGLLRHVVAEPAAARARAERGRERILTHFTWERVADLVAARCRELSARTPVRLAGARDAVERGRAEAERLHTGGNYVEASAVLLGLLDRYGLLPDLLSDLGVVTAALGGAAEALALFQQALEIDPRHTDAACNRGALLAQLAAAA